LGVALALHRRRRSSRLVGVHTGDDAGRISLRMIGEITAMADRNCALGNYRFFGVNDGDAVLWDRCIDCLDDDEARAIASSLSSGGVMVEVWDVARFVGRYDVLH
jgi:hypothetical protein